MPILYVYYTPIRNILLRGRIRVIRILGGLFILYHRARKYHYNVDLFLVNL